ncbi:MAG: class I SAM-dependent methyltransferase [Dehalococcoidia bacterium]|nr:class I SAM-dependent methyltransferase [Dehalococcoidia bacterium]
MTRPRGFDWQGHAYDWTMALVERALIRHRQELFSRATGRVLEIGVGTGATLPYYPTAGRVIGIDTSPSMLRRSGARAAGLGMDFTPIIMDAQSLAFPNGFFDTVISSLVLCSVADPHRALCEIRRVLRVGGIALLLEHVRPSGALGAIFDAANLVWSRVACQLNRRTESLVEGAGFDLLRREAPFSFLRVMEASPRPESNACEGGLHLSVLEVRPESTQ